MPGRKRTMYEPSGIEDDYVKKCTTCKYCYTKVSESDTLFCASRKGCNYKKIKEGGAE